MTITTALEGAERSGGLTGFISWRRLARVLTEAGETRKGERIVQIEADRDGLKIIYEARPTR